MKNEKRKRNSGFVDDSFKLNMFKQFKQPKINFKKIKSYVLDALRGGDYEKLDSWIKQYLPSHQEKEDFFGEEGHNILKFVLAYLDDLRVFEYISKFFSITSITSALKKNNYEVIQEFLAAQCGAEMFGHDDESQRRIRIEKFKILLRYAKGEVEAFMAENKDVRCMTVKIKEDFVAAQQDTNSNQVNSINSKMRV